MDRALSPEEHARLSAILDDFDSAQVRFHSVQTRVAGHARFISMHVLLPGARTIQQGHDLVEQLEKRLVTEFEHAQVFTHMEPVEDPRSYEDCQPGLAPRNGADRPPASDPATEAGAG